MTRKSYLFLLIWVAFFSRHTQAADFYAHYTHLKTSEAFEKYSRTGDYADVVVVAGTNKLVFWRGTSYLPYLENAGGKWPVDEIITRKGDGTTQMPDATNMFSHVSIISANADSIVVLWRYLPQFKINKYPHFPVDASQTQFAEELFTIRPDGKVTRSIRKPQERIDDWNRNLIIQKFTLSNSGMIDKSMISKAISLKEPMVKSRAIARLSGQKPVISFRLDEAKGDSTREIHSGKNFRIEGHKSYWKEGVSGTSLQFDGYTSLIRFQEKAESKSSSGLSIQTWIAIGAYPWNQIPLVQLGQTNQAELTLDEKGFPGFKIQQGGNVLELKSKLQLEHNRWYFLAGTFDVEKSEIRLFLNGKQTDSTTVNLQDFSPDFGLLKIGGSGTAVAASDPVREDVNFPTVFGFDGLMDEVSVFDKLLSEKELLANFSSFNMNQEAMLKPDMPFRQLPVIGQSGKFGGSYTNLNYFETWDNLWRFGSYPDVVVASDLNPVKFVFWKGTNDIPCIVNDKNQYYSNEFNETWYTSGGSGCQEPMSDKKLLTTHARIIENSPARTVVEWRVALMDTKSNIQANYDSISNWGDWTDWLYYIYPDGLAVKHMRLYTSGKLNHEWQEGMAIIGENTRPEEVIEQSPVYYYVNDSGKVIQYDWKNAFTQKIDYASQRIFVANFKSDWDPFTICDFTGGDIYNNNEYRPYSVFCNWNHWPTAMIKSDGRFTSFSDRATHSSLNHIFWDLYTTHKGDIPYYEKIMIEGMSNKKAGDLYPLSCSWMNPPSVTDIKGTDSVKFLPTEKAYTLIAKNKSISFTILANAQQPIVNPCITVSNWNSDKLCKFFLNGKLLTENKDFRQGVVRDTDGKQKLVIWLNYQSGKSTSIRFQMQ